MSEKQKFLIATIAIWAVKTLIIWLTCGWLFSWVYKIPPVNIWLEPQVMMSVKNMLYSNVIALLMSGLFVWVYTIIYKGVPGTGIKNGINFGILIWLVSALPGMASMPFFMTIATTVIIYWIIQALVINIVSGLILGAIYKNKL
ncbi:MAG: hypothetical protein GF332_00500 [Candidatus Moranbacteria bacterium]|nr:hypothetical protein [Candidatus Moranbacteria bacterium]